MSIDLVLPPSKRLFLGVRRSVTGLAWEHRLVRAPRYGRAWQMAQIHGIPELIARVLAGRGVAVPDAVSFSRSDDPPT
jgi:single-stranded-DNA-specific exonuclease